MTSLAQAISILSQRPETRPGAWLVLLTEFVNQTRHANALGDDDAYRAALIQLANTAHAALKDSGSAEAAKGAKADG